MKTLIPFFFLLLAIPFLAAQNDVCQIDLPSTRVAAYAHGEQVQFTFEYSIGEAGGARIFARPFTNGALTPGYGASGSPLYTGDGTGSAFFTINSGQVIVDEIRFLILTGDQSATLREFYIPVTYYFGENGVNNFSFSQEQEIGSSLLGEQVDITFDYNINHPGGTRIFVRPFTNGSLTPGYGASGSPIFSGTGSQTANFSINSGTNVRVDELRVTVLNADQSVTLNTFFIPVNWYWSTVKVTNISILGSNFAANGESRTIRYDYETNEAAGVRIFPRPFTDTGLTPGYGACGSGLHTGSGTVDCSFTINGNNQRVDHIRFMATNADQSVTLLEMYQPTDIFFGNLLIENLVTCPPSPARLLHDERVNGFFDYTNNEGESGRMFFRPATNGSLSPNYAAAGSPAYGTGNGQGNAYFTITSGNIIVDQIHFLTTNESQSENWGTFRFNVNYVYGPGMSTPVRDAHAPEYLSWQIAPNPVQDQAVLRLSSEQKEVVDIYLLDAYGRKMAQWTNINLTAGQTINHPINVRQIGLSSGLYFVHIQGSNYHVTEKIVVNSN